MDDAPIRVAYARDPIAGEAAAEQTLGVYRELGPTGDGTPDS